jgi:hypothetical protein
MKKIIVLFLIANFSITVYAQMETASYTKQIDELTTEKTLKQIQFFLGSEVILTKNETPQEIEVTKRGAVKIIDRRIILEQGLMGVFDKIEGVGSSKVIWIKFKKKETTISIPFKLSGPGPQNAFVISAIASEDVSGLGAQKQSESFKNNNDSYAFTGAASLEIKASFIEALIKAGSIKVKN